jgi:hypothetical protein
MNPRDENMPPATTDTEDAVSKTDSANDSGSSEGEKQAAHVKPAPETKTTTASSKKRPATGPATLETDVDDEAAVEVEPAKRSRHEDEDREVEGEVLDLATTLGLKVGDRFEVEWEITQDDSEESGDDAAAAADTNADTKEETVTTRWWGATLLEHNGRTEDSVAVRVLDYDPYPEGGFPEHSPEEVIFLGRDILIDPNTHEEMHYRREGDDDSSAVYLGREGVEEVVNESLANAMQKNSKSWNGLSRAQQASIADIIAQKKEKLLELLLSQPNGVVTTSEMHAIIAKTMAE